MAKSNNYFWWSPEKWRDTLLSHNLVIDANMIYDRMKDMTHHERRLYIRLIMKDSVIPKYLKLDVPSNRAL